MHDLSQVLVDSLFIYPVKACRGVRVSGLRFMEAGTIERDREWVIAGPEGNAVWQGSHPRLALVQPAINGGALVLTAPGVAPVAVSRSLAENPCRVNVWNDFEKISETYEGYDAGPEAAAFLHAASGDALRLIRLAAGGLKRDSINPAHLCSASSLHELNQALAAQGYGAVEIDRFRPNIVIKGIASPLVPFIEEQFARLDWTDNGIKSSLSLYGKCIRCVVPNVDLVTAETSDEPGNTVAALSAQRYPGQPSYFGVYGKIRPNGSIQQGTVMNVELSF